MVFTVVEKPHPHFARDGNNLIFTAKARQLTYTHHIHAET